MRASPAWFTSRPLSSYPADDEGELDDPFFARETPAVATASFNGKRILGFGLISVLGILLSLFVIFPLVRDTLMGLRSVPPGLWSNNGVLMIGKEQFHLKGVSWFGFEGPTNCLEGLGTGENSLDNILDIVRAHNFNLLRLPLALDKWLENPSMAPNCISAFANPDLKVHPYRRLIRLVIERAAEKDLLVLLDLHRLDSNIWPSDGKWSSKAVSPEIVVTFWENLAVEFGRQWNVVGADIFNEPHGAEDWVSWKEFSEQTGNRILELAPSWAIFVEGVGNLPDDPRPEPVFWAENLAPSVENRPSLIHSRKLVLSPHVYGPSVYNQSYFKNESFPHNMPGIWDDHFGRAVESGAAVVVGEFGGRNIGADSVWQDSFVRYASAKQFGLIYWCLNPSSEDTGGFLNPDWMTVDESKAEVLNLAKHSEVRKHLPAFKRLR